MFLILLQQRKKITMKYDYLIVGQGLAGTLLSYFLIKNGQRVLVIDDEYQTSSSKIAAGIINPITGRRYVKSWLFEELMPFARSTYQELSETLGITCFEPRNIIRVLFNIKEENDYYSRSGEVGYQHYMLENPNYDEYETVLEPVFSVGEVTNSGKVNLQNLLHTYRTHLNSTQSILTETFDYQHLIINKNHIQYKQITASKIIFCDGIKSLDNPYFSYLPFNGAKGEVLIVRIPNFEPQKIFKHRMFFVPLEKDLFWIGATNQNDYHDALPTTKGKKELEEKLNEILKIPYEIIEHHAAIRPNVKDRRPFIGVHPKIDNLLIFNGLGTKGSSIGPYFAQHFTDFLLGKSSLMPSVDIKRYENLFF